MFIALAFLGIISRRWVASWGCDALGLVLIDLLTKGRINSSRIVRNLEIIPVESDGMWRNLTQNIKRDHMGNGNLMNFSRMEKKAGEMVKFAENHGESRRILFEFHMQMRCLRMFKNLRASVKLSAWPCRI